MGDICEVLKASASETRITVLLYYSYGNKASLWSETPRDAESGSYSVASVALYASVTYLES